MKTYKLPLALLALFLLSATTVHANSSSGTVRFTGSVYLPTSASVDYQASRTNAPVAAEQTDSLQHFRQAKPCAADMLDYFETYAAKEAKVVSVTYL
jgi:hypothetical protein